MHILWTILFLNWSKFPSFSSFILMNFQQEFTTTQPCCYNHDRDFNVGPSLGSDQVITGRSAIVTIYLSTALAHAFIICYHVLLFLSLYNVLLVFYCHWPWSDRGNYLPHLPTQNFWQKSSLIFGKNGCLQNPKNVWLLAPCWWILTRIFRSLKKWRPTQNHGIRLQERL